MPGGTIKTRIEMPFLLLVGFGVSAFFAILGTVVYSILLVMSVLGNGPFTFNGESVEKAVFLRESLPFFLGYPIVLGVFGLVAYGLWKEKPWSREAMMGFWVVGIITTTILYYVTGAPPGEAGIGFVSYALMAAIAWWYLYSKESVVEYFRAVAAKARDS